VDDALSFDALMDMDRETLMEHIIPAHRFARPGPARS
jgi:hypothetical protein